jgi:lipopolysaccharide biosynthesis glycosyltransferase
MPPEPGIEMLDGQLDARMPQVSPRFGHSGAMLGRLSLDKLLPAYYEKILYIDADVWIGKREISELFAIDLKDFAVAAVRDMAEIVRPRRIDVAALKRVLGLAPDVPYFNSGVLLLNRVKFAEQCIGERALAYITDGRYPYDQDALNAVLEGDWLELSPLWNWTFNRWPWLTAEFAPGIIHFIGGSKPWSDYKARYIPFYREEMRRYLSTIGYPAFVQPVPVYRSVQRVIIHCGRRALGMLNLDRRSRAIRTFMRERSLEPLRKADSRSVAHQNVLDRTG